MKPRAVLERIEPYNPGQRIPGGIKLASNENPFGPSPRAIEAVTGMLNELHFYPDGGMHQLRTALAREWDVSPEMVIAGNGSDEVLVMIAGAVIEPGTNAITAEHTFSQYAFSAQIFGADVRIARMRDGHFDLQAMADQIDDQTRIVFLCSPNNPTGTIIGARELAAFLERMPSHVLVVVDEAYGEYVTSTDYPNTIALIAGGANLIRLRTFSKVYGLAALRVGYGIARGEVIAAVSRLRQPFNVGTVGQVAAAAALADHEFVRRTLENNDREKERLCRFLDAHSLPYFPTEANFVCASFARPGARNVNEALHDERITVRPLVSFGMPDHMRISIGTPDEMDALYEALDRILGG